MVHTLPELPYAYDALEPFFDEATMKLHHDKHHATYVANLNAAIDKHPELAEKSALDLVKDLSSVPEDIRTAVQNNGGGHVNHSFFWEILAANAGGKPTGAIGEAIVAKFGDFDAFKEAFKTASGSAVRTCRLIAGPALPAPIAPGLPGSSRGVESAEV